MSLSSKIKLDFRSPALWLFLLLLVTYAYFFPRWADWGQNSKLDLTLAIVDQGSFVIDDYYENTGDYALYKGKHYSDKAPGTSFAGVPFYAAFKIIASTSLVDNLITRLASNPAMTATLRDDGTGLLYEKVYQAMALYMVTFFVVSIPSAFAGALLYVFLGYFTPNKRIRLLAVLLYGLGTITFPYSQIFSGRQLAAVLIIISFYVLFRIQREEISQRYLWLVGFLMGYSLITDYPSVFMLAALFFYAIFSLRDLRKLLPLILAGTLPVLVMMAYNYACFDTPIPVGYKYSELWQDEHTQGFLSITYPHLDSIYGLTFSPFRGLFFTSPALLMCIPGFAYWFCKKEHRLEFWVVLISTLSTFLFYGSSIMWWGGFAVGPSYLTVMMPMLTFPIAYFLQQHVAQRWVQFLATGIIALSIVLIWVQTIAGQSYPDLSPNPLFQLSLPTLAAGDVARNLGMLTKLHGLASVLPLGLLMLVIVIILYRLTVDKSQNRT